MHWRERSNSPEFTNRISWRAAIFGVVVVSLPVYTTTRLIVILPEGGSVIETAYSRVFEVENEALVEYFAAPTSARSPN